MTTMHTPGPWFPRKNSAGMWEAMIEDRDYAHSTAFITRTDDQGAADARLIAAAPELLAALKGVLRVADRQTDEFDAARAAIAKATAP